MAEVSHLWRVIQAWLDELPFPPTQSKLGESVGVKRSSVSEWKYGTATPTPEHMRALADLMVPVYGPDAFEDLIAAMNADGGYILPTELAARRSTTKPRRGPKEQQPD